MLDGCVAKWVYRQFSITANDCSSLGIASPRNDYGRDEEGQGTVSEMLASGVGS